MLAIVRLHPEPADDCPCFDDSVAFAGVTIGIQIAAYTYPRTSYSWSHPVPGTTPYSLEQIGVLRTILRIILGVLIVFAWRATMKPSLLRILPPIFRIVENIGADLPREFFLKASQYKTIPTLRKDDNVIPSARDIPKLITDVRQRRGRAVSIGPQSAADAYETIAYRHEQRRRSISNEPTSPATQRREPSQGPQTADEYFGEVLSKARSNLNKSALPGASFLPTPAASRVQSYDQTANSDVQTPPSPLTPATSDDDLGRVSPIARLPSHTEEFPFYSLAEEKFREEEKEKREIFGKIEHPRVRYDVEVVTKLVVYAGIAWLAVQGNPVLFEVVGLGVGISSRE